MESPLEEAARRVLVFAPSPLLTVTIESRGSEPDMHIHAGGQGVWVARMVATLGVPVRLCGCFGGETGDLVQVLVEKEEVELVAVTAEVANAAYVHDRRSGEREVVAEMIPAPMSRHEVDQLYGAVVLEALEAEVCVLSGTPSPTSCPSTCTAVSARTCERTEPRWWRTCQATSSAPRWKAVWTS